MEDDDTQALTTVPTAPPTLADVAPIADRVTQSHTFREYQERLAAETKRRQKADLALLTRYLTEQVGIQHPGDFFTDLAAWRDISAGIVSTWLQWMLQEGYAIGSINVRLATVKAYCSLAYAAGILSTDTHSHIQNVKGFKRVQGRHVDEGRTVTRRGAKKASPTPVEAEHMDILKEAALATGLLSARDSLLVCLMCDLGLRAGEIAALQVSDIAMKSKTIRVYRAKVNKVQTFSLKDLPDTLAALKRHLPTLAWGQTSLFDDITTRAINKRVQMIGRMAEIEGHLSPHDLRHACFTDAARNETDMLSLKDAGGWSNIQTPARYVEAQKIANAGMKLTTMKRK